MTILRDVHNNLMIESRFAEHNVTRLRCVRPKCVHNQNGACSFNGMIEIGVKCKKYTENKPNSTIPADREEPNSGSGYRGWITKTVYGETEEEVLRKKEKYRKKYPPQGYGTYDSGPTRKISEGLFCGVVCRYSTCD